MSANVADSDLNHLLEIRRLYIPSDRENLLVGSLFAEESDGVTYRYGTMIGSDLDSADELLVLKRDEIPVGNLPPDGEWVEVDPSSTQLVVLRRNLGGNLLAPVEEFSTAKFQAKSEVLHIERMPVSDSEDIKLLITRGLPLGE